MKNNNFFFKIFDDSPTPTVILEGKFPNIVIKTVNLAYANLTGRTCEELIGMPFFVSNPHPGMRLSQKTYEDVKQSIAKVYTKKTTIKTPLQKFLKPIPNSTNFETLYLEATNTPVLNNDGEIDFVIRSMQNVTDIIVTVEKEMLKDRQLIENERFLSETQKVAKIGSWEMDKDNRFNWSDIHYDIMEIEQGIEITKEFGVNLLRRQIDRDVFAEVYKNAVEKGDHFDVELNITTPKGNERWIRFIGKGELKDGEFVRMYGVGQDITEQKLLQQQLLASNNKLETIIQTIDGVLFECNVQTLELNFVSEQVIDLLGYTPQECMSQPNFLKKLLEPGDIEEILNLATAQITTPQHFSREYRVIKKDGELKWVRVSVSVISENGVLTWLRGLMIDITVSKRVSELERVEKKVLELNADPSSTTIDVLKCYLKGIESVFPEMQCSIMEAKHGYLNNWVTNSLPAVYLAAIDHIPIGDNTGSCGTAAFKNETVIASDIATDPRWSAYKEIALQNELLSCWSQPIRNTAGEVIATLGMYYKIIKSPTEEELKVIDRVAYLFQVILQHRYNLELLEDANLLMEQSQEMAHFGSGQYDIASREIIWSKELCNIFGLDKNEKPSIDFYYKTAHPDDKDRITAIIQNSLRTKEDFIAEERIIRRNGEVRNLKTWGRIKTDENDKIIKVISTYLDITESKKIQEDLLASESRLRSLVESQTNYVIRIDFDERYSYVNNKYIEDFGAVNEQSLLGSNSLDFVVPHQRKSVQEISRKCVAYPNVVFEVELEKYGNDGNIKHTFWHFVCLTSSKGEPREIQCIGVDITDLKEAEKERERKTVELEDSEKRYNDLFHLSPQPMLVYDPDSLQFLDVNKAAVEQYGYSLEEFLKMTMENIQKSKRTKKLPIKEKDFYQRIFTHILKNREEIRVNIKRTEIPFKGKIANLVLAINITEPITYLEALEKQNLLLSEIAWIQSHEVRAPLSRIIGLIDILQNHDNEEVENQFILKGIASSAHELDQVILDIVSKAEQLTIIPNKNIE
jgi:PAS domain S-box-containing protein